MSSLNVHLLKDEQTIWKLRLSWDHGVGLLCHAWTWAGCVGYELLWAALGGGVYVRPVPRDHTVLMGREG